MPLPMPSTLNDVFSMNPAAFNQAQEMIGLGMQQGQADLKKTQLANLFDEQNNPHLVQNSQLRNQSLEAQIPGMRADSESKQLKTGRERATQDDAIMAARKDFLAKASDDDLKMLENEGQKMAYSPDPTIRANGERILNMHKEMVKERSKQADMGNRRLAEIRESGNQARLTQQQAIDAGKFKKSGKSQQDELEKALVSGSWDKAATAYDAMAQRAMQEGDTDGAMYYAAKAKEYSDKFILARNQQKPGGVDPVAVTGLPGVAQPTTQPPLMPNATGPARVRQDLANGAQFSSPEVEAKVRAYAAQGQPQAPTPGAPPKMSMGQLQQMYPGVPPEKLREAFKKKFGIDVQ